MFWTFSSSNIWVEKISNFLFGQATNIGFKNFGKINFFFPSAKDFFGKIIFNDSKVSLS